jgi:hypothetical protein
MDLIQLWQSINTEAVHLAETVKRLPERVRVWCTAAPPSCAEGYKPRISGARTGKARAGKEARKEDSS